MTVFAAAKALLYEKYADTGLVGQVFREDGPERIVYVADVTVPIVDYGSDHTRGLDALDDAPAGDYFLQLSIPNGDVVTKKFSIAPDTDTPVVISLPHEGPHEWTTLHALTGQFREESRKTKGFNTLLSREPKSYAQLFDTPETGFAVRLLAPGESDAGGILESHTTISDLSRMIRANRDVRSVQEDFGSSLDVTQPTLEDDDYAIFRIAHAGVLTDQPMDKDPYAFDLRASMSRHYLLQQSAAGGMLICLPTPWTTPEGEVEVELLVKKYNLPQTLDYSLTIGDPMINTVLGYINMGAVHKAVELVNLGHAQRMLYSKLSCPFAATVGGYLLVLGLDRNGYRAQSDTWQTWVRNLDLWFEWLPDGAILHAALHFMLGATTREKAYEALMRSYDRGLPFFTFGLKLMMDGMRYFAGLGDAQARDRLVNLETIANSADPSQMFLSVTFSKTWQSSAPTRMRVMANV